MLVVKLPQRSWYGDFQILFNIESSFQLEAGEAKKSKENKIDGVLQLYKLNGETLIDLVANYPQYRQFLILRAAQRRSQFLKTFDEMQQTFELTRKSRGIDTQSLEEQDPFADEQDDDDSDDSDDLDDYAR